jgi:arylsulfatase
LETIEETGFRGQDSGAKCAHPRIVADLRAAYDQWWSEIQPMLVNEDVPIPDENPYKTLYDRTLGKSSN